MDSLIVVTQCRRRKTLLDQNAIEKKGEENEGDVAIVGIQEV